MENLSSQVLTAMSHLEYYVYALVDPQDQKIFYIGKGKDDRVFRHATDALETEVQSDKLETIRKIINQGKGVQYYILRHNLTEEVAYIVESTLIDMLTYTNFNTESILTNLQAGHHQWDEGIKTINEITALYACEPIQIKSGDYLLLVSLNKTYNQKKMKGVYVRSNLYECTRKYWKIADWRTQRITHVLGVYQNVVREVIEVDKNKWTSINDDNGTIRYCCEGVEQPNSEYMNKFIPEEHSFGRGGAVTYITE